MRESSGLRRGGHEGVAVGCARERAIARAEMHHLRGLAQIVTCDDATKTRALAEPGGSEDGESEGSIRRRLRGKM
jgi:hypothetical protein